MKSSTATKADAATRARRGARGVATSSNVELSALWLSGEEGKAIAVKRCRDAIKAANGSIEKAAEALGIGRRTLYRWAEQYPEIKKAS